MFLKYFRIVTILLQFTIFTDMINIIIVDDEQDVRFLLKFNLEAEGYKVNTAPSAEDALVLFEKNSYNLAILDIMMGGMSGLELAKRLRSNPATSDIGIIFITALDGEENVINGLNIGGDDYITKTLSIREIKARVRAVLRRNSRTGSVEELRLDLEGKRAILNSRELNLTKLEFELLVLLYNNPGKVYSREVLMKTIWPTDAIVLERAVDVSVRRLRSKLGEFGSRIKTRVGYGYYFE